MYNFLRFIVFIAFIIMVPSTFKLADNMIKLFKLLKERNSNIMLIDELHNLTREEFRRWCISYLYKNYNYEFSEYHQSGDGNRDFVCIKDDSKIYINCIKYSSSRNIKERIDVEHIKRLLALMESKALKKSLIITTGYVTKEAYNYIKALPKEYSIDIFEREKFNTEYA